MPCVACNQFIKFADLIETAKDLGAHALATGHYISARDDGRGGRALYRAKDAARDQSYFLFATTREQLRMLRFPLGDYTKAEVRDMARRFGLEVADVNSLKTSGDSLYLEHWGALVTEAGRRYDGHPFLDSVDISSVGYWGEGWSRYMPAFEYQRALIDIYLTAFTHTPLLMNFDEPQALRYGTEHGAGWRLDCLGDMRMTSGDRTFEPEMLDVYPQQIVRTGDPGRLEAQPRLARDLLGPGPLEAGGMGRRLHPRAGAALARHVGEHQVVGDSSRVEGPLRRIPAAHGLSAGAAARRVPEGSAPGDDDPRVDVVAERGRGAAVPALRARRRAALRVGGVGHPPARRRAELAAR